MADRRTDDRAPRSTGSAAAHRAAYAPRRVRAGRPARTEQAEPAVGAVRRRDGRSPASAASSTPDRRPLPRKVAAAQARPQGPAAGDPHRPVVGDEDVVPALDRPRHRRPSSRSAVVWSRARRRRHLGLDQRDGRRRRRRGPAEHLRDRGLPRHQPRPGLHDDRRGRRRRAGHRRSPRWAPSSTTSPRPCSGGIEVILAEDGPLSSSAVDRSRVWEAVRRCGNLPRRPGRRAWRCAVRAYSSDG